MNVIDPLYTIGIGFIALLINHLKVFFFFWNGPFSSSTREKKQKKNKNNRLIKSNLFFPTLHFSPRAPSYSLFLIFFFLLSYKLLHLFIFIVSFWKFLFSPSPPFPQFVFESVLFSNETKITKELLKKKT